jgi:hypothetical protein
MRDMVRTLKYLMYTGATLATLLLAAGARYKPTGGK